MRPSKRADNELRPIKITRAYNKHAEGSALIEFGDTKVICTVSFVAGVPKFLKDSGKGWLTAEYGMLPRATGTRTEREASRGKQGGRTLEIQRLIGRALRSVVDLNQIGENTLLVDCDVIQADGGTRTAAITGSSVALFDAINYLHKKGKIAAALTPLKQLVAAVSVGIYHNQPILDLDYQEDSNCETDMNIVMTEDGNFIELQGTAERGVFTNSQLNDLLALAKDGIKALLQKQHEALSKGL